MRRNLMCLRVGLVVAAIAIGEATADAAADPGSKITECAVGTGAPAQPLGVGPTGLAHGADGHLWFLESSGTLGLGGVGRITLGCSGYTEYIQGITPRSTPWSMAAGPDGKLWFTEATGLGRVGSVTMAGEITEYLLTPTISTYEIIAGPDGNMWFTSNDPLMLVTGLRRGVVGRFSPRDPEGTLRTWEVGGLPSGLTVGPDGNVWFMQGSRFTDGKEGGLGTISRKNGSYTYHPFPADKAFGPTNSALTTAELTTGPDGNLWFIEEWEQSIGRYSPSDGTFTFFSKGLDVGNMHLSHIITASDGNMYAVDHGPGAYLLYRITPDGTITGIPSWDGTAGGAYLAEMPDGTIWGSKSDDIASSGLPPTYVGGGRLFRMALPVVSPPAGKDQIAPKLSKLSLSGRRGVRLRLTLSEPATVRVSLRRKSGKTYRTVRVSTRKAKRGRTTLTVTSKRLRAGRYRLVVTATDASGNRSRSRTLSFTRERSQVPRTR